MFKVMRLIIAVILATAPFAMCEASKPGDIFARGNLVAWNIIPFDTVRRTPLERAQMLKRLGIARIAIDWRARDVASFDEQVAVMRNNGIAIQAFWMRGNMHPERQKAAAGDGNLDLVLATLKRNRLRTQIWDPFDADAEFMALSQEEKLKRATAAVRYVASRAAEIGCSVAIYSHGGWMGEPENELEVVKRVGMRNVGIVYDYENAVPQIDRFPQFFPKLVPHLWAVILFGMQDGVGPLVTLGQGNRDLEMLKVIHKSGYRGRIAIINHDDNRDAEVGLRLNIEGLKKLLGQLDDRSALRTYQR